MGTSGIEPPTSRLSGVRSNHLSYAPKLKNLVKMNKSSKRVTRIELATTAWKAVVLPLNYTRLTTKWRETESNRRHKELQSFALPTELPSHNVDNIILIKLLINTTVLTGFEPVISCVTGRRDNPYTIGPNCGSRIWTYDLRVMSPTSYLAAPSRVNYKEDVGFEPTHAFTRLTVFKTVPFSRTWVILQNL